MWFVNGIDPERAESTKPCVVVEKYICKIGSLGCCTFIALQGAKAMHIISAGKGKLLDVQQRRGNVKRQAANGETQLHTFSVCAAHNTAMA